MSTSRALLRAAAGIVCVLAVARVVTLAFPDATPVVAGALGVGVVAAAVLLADLGP
ncbi:hypothetical protein [Halosegnis marinus]|uniref:Uncharacterized protein n=1 Tax=Halosegnis marinus TaxID=3034023 RepID=A0ABD5ZNN7_9EURY|nr:hypothetical protein [Halosegnis sp. DT85]